jgi:hypothetical protein
MRRLRNAAFALLTVAPILAAEAAATAADNVRLEDLTVMAVGALDGRAVLKGADGKLQVLKVGDTIPGTHAVLSQVLADKIVVKDTVVGADKMPKTQTVWISKPTQAGGRSSVQRLSSEAPPARIIEGVKSVPAPAPTNTNKPK